MTDPPDALPDVNVLLALTNPAHQHHRRAHGWLGSVARFATTPVTETGLVRLLLNRTVTGQDVSADQALGILRGIRADPRAFFLPDDATLAAPGIDLVGLVGHRQVVDLHLVELARRNRCSLVTFDRQISGSLTSVDQPRVTVL